MAEKFMPTREQLIEFGRNEEFFLFCDPDEFVDIAQTVLRQYAAPEMYEALRSFVRATEDQNFFVYWDNIKAAKAQAVSAMQKAKGEA